MGVTRFGLQIPSFTYPDVADDKLFEKIAEIAGRIRVGYGLDEGVNAGPVISQGQLDRVMSFIDAGSGYLSSS